MASHRQDDLSITDQATDWLETIDEATPQHRAAFIAWLKESPRHVGEFLAVSAIAREFSHVDGDRIIDIDALIRQGQSKIIALDQVEELADDKSSNSFRTKFRKPIFGLAATILAAAVILSWLVSSDYGRRYETAIGEQRSIELPDGSLVFMNARSKLTVRFSASSRDLELVSGEALFKVSRDANRPFRVEVGDTVVQAVGTQFNIYRHRQKTTISVLEGKVRVSNKDSEKPPTQFSASFASLDSGQEATIGADGRLSRLSPVNEAKVTAWRQRELVFRSDRLADVAAEFNRYNQAPQIRVEGDDARERRLTGIFDADDPESLVLFLSSSDLTVRREAEEVVIGSSKEVQP